MSGALQETILVTLVPDRPVALGAIEVDGTSAQHDEGPGLHQQIVTPIIAIGLGQGRVDRQGLRSRCEWRSRQSGAAV